MTTPLRVAGHALATVSKAFFGSDVQSQGLMVERCCHLHKCASIERALAEEDGAIHFWRIKENLQNQLPQSIHWSDTRWKRKFQYCTDVSGTIISELFKDIQDAILLILHYRTMLLFPATSSSTYFYHIGCALNLHSIINSGLIPGGQSSSKRQTVSILPIDPREKEHKDHEKIDLNVPRRAQYLHNAWRRHQDPENWADINLAVKRG